MTEFSSIQDYPPILYKFYASNKNGYDALKNNFLWASFPYQFNDPFDCSPVLWDINSFISQGLIRNHSLENILSKTGIVCLNNPEKDIENLLWGYYTNQEGFSIVFDQKQLSKDLLIYQSTFLEEVKYCNKNSFKKFQYSTDQNEFSLNVIKWIKQKQEIWEKENEWRYIFFDCNYLPGIELGDIDSRKKKYTKKAINNITLGWKFFEGYLLNKIENGYVYVQSESKDKFKKCIIEHLIVEPELKINWITVTENFEIVALPIKLKRNYLDKIEIQYL